jgi:hypothetical protein
LTLLTMHECRHTFASVLIDTGANPKAIQEVMGHSKIQTTFDVYGHLLPGSYDDIRGWMPTWQRRCSHLCQPNPLQSSTPWISLT